MLFYRVLMSLKAVCSACGLRRPGRNFHQDDGSVSWFCSPCRKGSCASSRPEGEAHAHPVEDKENLAGPQKVSRTSLGASAVDGRAQGNTLAPAAPHRPELRDQRAEKAVGAAAPETSCSLPSQQDAESEALAEAPLVCRGIDFSQSIGSPQVSL